LAGWVIATRAASKRFSNVETGSRWYTVVLAATHIDTRLPRERPSKLERRTAFAIAAPLLVVLYIFFSVSYLLGAESPTGEPLPRWLAAITGPTALYFAALTLSIRTRRYEQNEEDLWIGISTLLLIVNVTIFYAVAPADWASYNYVFVMLGIGTVVSSRGWFLALMAATLCAQSVTTLATVGLATANWSAIATTSGPGALIATFLFIVRRAAIMRVHALTLEADRKRIVAEEALGGARRARADLQQLVERAPDAVLILVDNTIRYANQNFLDCLRLDESKVVGVDLSTLTYAGSLEDHGTSRLSFRRADGETVILEFSEATNIEQEGAEAQLRIGRDVSAADSDLQAKLQLSDRMAAIGVLALGVAHEINNPLAYVLGNLSAIEDESEKFAHHMSPETSDEFAELITDALHGARRVATIVKDLSSIARTEETNMEADVPAALDSSIRIAQPHLTHNSQLIVEIADVQPAACNQARLSQIFLNLIINAAQSLEENKKNSITIRCKEEAFPPRIVVEIEDTGSGMNADTQRRLFEPFYTTKAVGQGTGLGLYFCMNEIEKVGGELSFTSEEGVGTCFTIRLPLFASKGKRAATSPKAHTSRGLQILVIDDDPMVCKALERLLRGNETTVVSDANQGLALLIDEHFDVIFCDMMMPGMTGDLLYAKAAAALPGVGEKFIFITGGAFTPETEQFLDSVPGQVVLKPFGRNSLQAALQRRSLGTERAEAAGNEG